MAVVPDLLAAIAADPEDEAPQLVIADWLLGQDDPRGELIVLDHRDRTSAGGLTDPAAVERLLLLAAEYTFPYARDPDDQLPFVGGGAFPVQYTVEFGGHHYYVRYRHNTLSIEIDGGDIDSGIDYPDGYEGELPIAMGGEWTEEETAVMLTVLGDAIRAGTPFAELRFPGVDPALPTYDGGPLRLYRLPEDFTAPRGLARDRYGLAARDYQRWNATWRRLRDR